ncbi:hypothetical protein [Aeromonas hydrophila]|uniref:hypothetical protein n=1 Tax=Aeromonas hydrophila TaxID=644 RepID=UPI000574CC06|nr:hypothetical protein [Aeromonas hydrophila]KHN63699.1 hypothetical protein OI72_02830 [Aeromonas hydrophila]OFC43523.1 hypothetical protein BA189_03890 [Aeromonas hydrophila]OFC54607.1 hypothetical protein BA188_07345 [Aeromonas hydrophila]
MSWTTSSIHWPASAAGMRAQVQPVLAQVPGSNTAALARLDALAGRAHYPVNPLSGTAAALAGLRTELDALLANGRALSVTPEQYGVGQEQGGDHALSAPNAVARLAAKLRDGADPLTPTGSGHAVAWLVTAQSAGELASLLAILCPVLPIPAWCATLRRLQASNDAMTQPTAPMVPRWRQDEPLIWEPLRQTRSALGASIAQLESLAADSQTPIARLQTLAARRQDRLSALDQALDGLAALSGQLWHWQGTGDAVSLASQLEASNAPSHAHTHTVATLLLSATPITFWQELTS